MKSLWTNIYFHCQLVPSNQCPVNFACNASEDENSLRMKMKTVVAVDMLCAKCKKKVLKLIARIEGINSVTLDSSKGLVTVVGDADPTCIIRNIRKFRKSAMFVTIGPFKEEKKEEKKDEKKDKVDNIPRTCQKCDTWFIIREDDYFYNPCAIL
ncbi:Copper chaperone domain-containing protein [Dioscorea alata]|uniref:Copper chaperone domain-containing protein n=1 Tax=Dioscorea alata TaxID=55571 RepID=A0ACB7UF04_DIOAL|nr:Copper chaperone domain-containing protein [Dioscorea alata]